MNRSLSLSLALVVLAMASAAFGEPAAAPAPAPAPAAAPAIKTDGPQPKLVMGDLIFNAGDVAKGDVILHDFPVKNEGKADLMILSVAPACGCTAPDWTKIIPPGGSGKISLKVDTARFKGPISKTATVTTNDAEQATFRLTVNATVKTFIDVLPQERVSFRQYRGEEKEQIVTIHSNEPGDFKINDVQVTGEGVKQELTKATDGTGDFKLRVWLDKTAPIGSMNGNIDLITNSGKEPKVSIAVNGTVLGQLSVNPSSLYFRIDTAPAGGAKEWRATTENLNVRKTGDAKGASVGKIGKDTRLTLMEEAGDWAKIRTDSTPPTEGWVSRKFIKEAPTTGVGAASADQAKVVSLTHRLETANVQITSVAVEGQKLDAKSLKVETEPVRPGQSYRVTVTYTGNLEKGNYTGTVVIKTTDKEEPEVKIPVYIVVA